MLRDIRYIDRRYASMDPRAVENTVTLPIAGLDDAVAVRVVLHDESNEDKATTAGSYLFRTETPR